MTDEPIFWAELLAKGGHTEVGALIEAVPGRRVLHPELPQGSCRQGIRIVAEEWIPQTGPGHHRAGSKRCRKRR